MAGNTVRLHRVLRCAPERIYRAFLDADARVKWLPPNGFVGNVHQLDANVGGGYRMPFRNFTTGNAHSFGEEYLELVLFERIRYSGRFDDPNLPGVMETAVVLRAVFYETELSVVQEGIPAVIPTEGCSDGKSRSPCSRRWSKPRFGDEGAECGRPWSRTCRMFADGGTHHERTCSCVQCDADARFASLTNEPSHLLVS